MERPQPSYGKQATETVKHLLGAPWAQITIVTDWELATPDVEPVMAKLVNFATVQGFSREAVVNAGGTVKMEQFNKTLKVAENEFVRRVFDNLEDAKQWLAQEGFSCD